VDRESWSAVERLEEQDIIWPAEMVNCRPSEVGEGAEQSVGETCGATKVTAQVAQPLPPARPRQRALALCHTQLQTSRGHTPTAVETSLVPLPFPCVDRLTYLSRALSPHSWPGDRDRWNLSTRSPFPAPPTFPYQEPGFLILQGIPKAPTHIGN
jgi:hypothetical protein